MRIVPRSLAGRLLGIATLTTLAALAFAAFSIGHVLERFVIQGLDQQLDAEVTMLARAMRSDGTLDRARVVDLPVFDMPGEGWGWRVESARGSWTGGDPIDGEVPVAGPGGPLDHRGPEPSDMHPGEGIARSGERVHVRQRTLDTTAGPAVLTVSGPRQLALAPLRDALVPLLGSLALLGVGLVVATVLQLRFGLRPLRTLRASLADVRAGRAERLPTDQPDELAPLAAELNALIDQNEAGLEHARRHVANLAHGLKTPLAALSLKLAEGGQDRDGSLGAIVADIDGRIRHHLGRARAAAPGGATRVRTLLRPAVDDLVAVLRRVHADKPVTVSIDVAATLVVVADAQDLSEMLGNLLDNAWRHTATAIAVNATPAGAYVGLRIEDDGPGIPEQGLADALARGRRLDERGDGHGFGLPIAEELAELNGGSLTLSASRSGGLCAKLTLPAGQAELAPGR
jgi:signal transduction histidine kinase